LTGREVLDLNMAGRLALGRAAQVDAGLLICAGSQRCGADGNPQTNPHNDPGERNPLKSQDVPSVLSIGRRSDRLCVFALARFGVTETAGRYAPASTDGCAVGSSAAVVD
jgi:hypothetical protein